MQFLCARALFKNLCVAVFRFSKTARHSSVSWATLKCRTKVSSQFFPSRPTAFFKNPNLPTLNIEDMGTNGMLIKLLQKFNKHIWEKQCWGGVSTKKIPKKLGTTLAHSFLCVTISSLIVLYVMNFSIV